MAISPSIIQEYYRVVDYWADVETEQKWKLAIWLVEYTDVDLIEKFMEIECSPLGLFDDIFFRFDSEYTGENLEYAKSLWDEYISWFTEKVDEKYDVMKALRDDNMFIQEYMPDTSLERTASNLWKEMLRFKSCIKGLEHICFCIYFPPGRPDGIIKTQWFKDLLIEGIPDGIRIVTTDYKKKRRIDLNETDKIKIIRPALHMKEALQNELNKADAGGDLLAPENQFKQQVTKVMDCTLKKDKKLMDKEVRILLDLAKEFDDASIHFSSLFIASQAYYAIKEYSSSMDYCEKTIKETEQEMDNDVPTGYSYWRMALFLKAAILSSQKDRKEAIELYEKVAEKALEKKDAYYVMESYRLSGFLLYEQGKLDQAFERFLLSMTAGSYLEPEIRRSSTFIYSAHLALYIGRKQRSPNEVETIESQLKIWLGDDWQTLVENPDMDQASIRRRASIFS